MISYGRQAFVIALDRFVRSAHDTGSLTYNGLVDALVARFCLFYREHTVRKICDMTKCDAWRIYREALVARREGGQIV